MKYNQSLTHLGFLGPFSIAFYSRKIFLRLWGFWNLAKSSGHYKLNQRIWVRENLHVHCRRSYKVLDPWLPCLWDSWGSFFGGKRIQYWWVNKKLRVSWWGYVFQVHLYIYFYFIFINSMINLIVTLEFFMIIFDSWPNWYFWTF